MYKRNSHYAALFFLLISLLTLSHADEPSSSQPALEDLSDIDNNQALFEALDNFLDDSSFYGEWEVPQDFPFLQLESKTGFFQLSFPSDLWISQSSMFQHQILFQFYDGPYVDGNFVKLLALGNGEDPSVSIENSTISFSNCTVKVWQKELSTLSRKELPVECNLDISIYFLDMRNNQPFNVQSPPDPDNFAVQAFLTSSSCNFELNTSYSLIKDPVASSQFLPYILSLLIFAALECIAYRVFYQEIRKKPLYALNFSLGTFCFLATFDLYLFMGNIYFSTSLSDFVIQSSFQVIGLTYATITVFADLPFLIEIKTKVSRLQWQEISKKVFLIAKICLPFNLIAFTFSFEAVTVQLRTFFYIIFAFFPLPQIIQNFVLEKRYQWSFWFLGGLVVPKIAYLIYTEGYSYNLFRSTPSYDICLGISYALSAQFIILLIQTRWPRFGFNKPQAYRITQSDKAESQNCPICLQDFSIPEDKNSLEDSLLASTTATSTSEYTVVTPCRHEFHLSCLKSWLDQRFECPYCRQPLPVSYQLDEPQGSRNLDSVL